MLSLTETDVTACQTMQLLELLEQYPMLSEQQLMFYVDHRQHTAITPYGSLWNMPACVMKQRAVPWSCW